MTKEIDVQSGIEIDLGVEGIIPIIPENDNYYLADWVSRMTNVSETMLPKSIEEVMEMFSQERSVILLDDQGEPLAHGAVTFLYEEVKMVEVGGIVVDPNKRRKGYGTMAAYAATLLAKEKFPGWKIMVLCNKASLPIFLKLGGSVVDFDSIKQIPEAAWEACVTCPKYAETKAAGKFCCDTPVLMP